MELLSKIKQFIETNDFLVSEVAKKKNLLRICINSLGNPQCSLLLPQFLYMLKCILRASFATAFITIPTHLLNQVSLRYFIAKFKLSKCHLMFTE